MKLVPPAILLSIVLCLSGCGGEGGTSDAGNVPDENTALSADDGGATSDISGEDGQPDVVAHEAEPDGKLRIASGDMTILRANLGYCVRKVKVDYFDDVEKAARTEIMETLRGNSSPGSLRTGALFVIMAAFDELGAARIFGINREEAIRSGVIDDIVRKLTGQIFVDDDERVVITEGQFKGQVAYFFQGQADALFIKEAEEFVRYRVISIDRVTGHVRCRGAKEFDLTLKVQPPHSFGAERLVDVIADINRKGELRRGALGDELNDFFLERRGVSEAGLTGVRDALAKEFQVIVDTERGKTKLAPIQDKTFEIASISGMVQLAANIMMERTVEVAGKDVRMEIDDGRLTGFDIPQFTPELPAAFPGNDQLVTLEQVNAETDTTRKRELQLLYDKRAKLIEDRTGVSIGLTPEGRIVLKRFPYLTGLVRLFNNFFDEDVVGKDDEGQITLPYDSKFVAALNNPRDCNEFRDIVSRPLLTLKEVDSALYGYQLLDWANTVDEIWQPLMTYTPWRVSDRPPFKVSLLPVPDSREEELPSVAARITGGELAKPVLVWYPLLKMKVGFILPKDEDDDLISLEATADNPEVPEADRDRAWFRVPSGGISTDTLSKQLAARVPRKLIRQWQSRK